MARSSVQAFLRRASDLIWVLTPTTRSIGPDFVDGRIDSSLSWVILKNTGLAESSQPSSVENEARNSPPPEAMLRFRSWKFTSANAACSRSALTTPPEVQFEVPEVMP